MSRPPLITPMFTGRSKKGLLFILLLLPGTNARSGMKAPAGTPMKRLLSISQTEYCMSADCAGADGKPVDTVSATNAKSKTDLTTLFISTPQMCLVDHSVAPGPRDARSHLP